MILKLLKMTASVKKIKQIIFCDFEVTIEDYLLIVKGCSLRKDDKGNLIIAFPKLTTEEKKGYTPFYFSKPEQHEEFRTKAAELIKQQNPDLLPYKDENYGKTNGADSKITKRDRKVFTKRDKQARRQDTNPGSIPANPQPEKPKADFSKFVDLPNNIRKPAGKFVR